jgi:hypothetical protein
MSRTLWLGLATAATAIVFVVLAFGLNAAVATAAVQRAAGSVADGAGGLIVVLDALAVAATAGFLLLFLVPALIDAAAARRVLARLRAADGSGDAVADAVHGVPFLERAAARTLPAFGADGGAAALPAERHFGPEPTVDRRLGTRLFRTCPIVLAGLGAAGAAAGLGMAGTAAGWGPFLVAGLLLAVAVEGLYAVAVAWRTGQARALCDEVDARLRTAAADPVADGIGAVRAEMHDLRETVAATVEALQGAADDHAERVARAVSTAVGTALTAPMARVADVSAVLAEDQREQLAGVLASALTRFTADLEARHGAQADRLNEALARLTENAQRLDARVAEATQRLVEGLDAGTHGLAEAMLDAAGRAAALPAAPPSEGTPPRTERRGERRPRGGRREDRPEPGAGAEHGQLDRLTRELLDLKDEARSLSADLPLPGNQHDDGSR